jgi:acyl-CoA synthetase (AMP-forming)/AMP-acid ligase II
VSPKLSPEAIASLLEQCQAQLLLTSVATTSRAEAAVGKLAKPLSLQVRLVSPDDFHHEMPPQMTMTSPAPSMHYCSSTDRNVIIFHSSGTTGLPKPVYHAHAYILKYGTCGDFSETECAGLNMTTLPLYHVGMFDCLTCVA